MNPLLLLLAAWSLAGPRPEELRMTLVGNAGVVVSDGVTTLLVDLPHEPGAFGYARYDPAALEPEGVVVSVITHAHRDHFDPRLFIARDGWLVVGPPSVVDGLPPSRILPGETVDVGDFSIVAIPTPHTEDHRSYRIRWRGRVLHFSGDTEDGARIIADPEPDLLFVSPWLACSLVNAGWDAPDVRWVLVHRRPDGSDRTCGIPERFPQMKRLSIEGR